MWESLPSDSNRGGAISRRKHCSAAHRAYVAKTGSRRVAVGYDGWPT